MICISHFDRPQPAVGLQDEQIRHVGEGGEVGDHAGEPHLASSLEYTPKQSELRSDRSTRSRGMFAAQYDRVRKPWMTSTLSRAGSVLMGEPVPMLLQALRASPARRHRALLRALRYP